MENEFYDLLGITQTASIEEVKEAYCNLVMENHADKGKVAELDNAYNCIIEERAFNDNKNVVKVEDDKEQIKNDQNDLSQIVNSKSKIFDKAISYISNILNTKEKKRIAIWSCCALIAVVTVLIVCLNIKSDKVSTALKSVQYDCVQVSVTQSFNDISGESESDNIDDQQSADDQSEESTYGNDSFNENVYYDENGSMITDSSGIDNESATNNEEAEEEVTVLKKYGDVFYEKGLSGECYYYSRDGKDYVLYYDDFYGIKKDNGTWTEVPAENYNICKAFDFSTLDTIKKADLKKTNDGYVLKDKNNDIFYNILQIQNKENYSDCDIKFYFSQGKVSKITASYLYSDKYEVKQTYSFSYKDEKIEVPKPDKSYSDNGDEK